MLKQGGGSIGENENAEMIKEIEDFCSEVQFRVFAFLPG